MSEHSENKDIVITQICGECSRPFIGPHEIKIASCGPHEVRTKVCSWCAQYVWFDPKRRDKSEKE